MSINKKTVEVVIVVLILVATGIVFEIIFLKKAQTPINQPAASVAQTQAAANSTSNNINPTNSDAIGSVAEQVPTAKLGKVSMKKIASIPKSPMVYFYKYPDFKAKSEGKFMLSDGLDIGDWAWAVSGDEAHHYAYVTVKNKPTDSIWVEVEMIFDGKKIGDIYSDIGKIQFSPDGKTLVYHGYDDKEDKTYLVIYNIDNKSMDKVFVYKGNELDPQARGVSVFEGFSGDSKHFAYEKLLDNKIEIFLDNKKIKEFNNDNDGGFDVVFNRGQNGSDILYAFKDNANSYVDYYIDERQVTFEGYNNLIEKKKTYITENGGLASLSTDKVVYIEDVPTDNKSKSIYTITPSKKTISLSYNSNAVKEIFDEIANFRFSSDNKSVQFVGRKGRDLYSVSYPIVN